MIGMAGKRPWTVPSVPCEFRLSDGFCTCTTCWACSKSIDAVKMECKQYKWEEHDYEDYDDDDIDDDDDTQQELDLA